ncbi:MAG TPA: DNA polymerase III subunit delta [Vicinamibacterales bacterium]
MATATPSAVRKQIASGAADPIYLLVGEDEVEKSALAAEFAELVDEGLRAFNVERIHAGDLTTGDRLADGVAGIVAAARTLPMMAPRRIVMVTQAETLLMPKRESEAATRAMDELEQLLERPERETALIFVAANVDRRSRMFKVMQKYATVVECGAIEDVGDAERWIRTRIAAAGVDIDPAAAHLLARRSGLDIKRLRGDVERLLLFALGQQRIGVDDVREIAGPAVALVEDWGMANAIEAANTAEALRHLGALLDAGSAPEMVLGQLGWLVRSKFPAIAPRHVRPSVDALFRTDLDLKRSAGDPRILLERLVVELCARGALRARGESRRQP